MNIKSKIQRQFLTVWKCSSSAAQSIIPSRIADVAPHVSDIEDDQALTSQNHVGKNILAWEKQ